MSVTIIGYILAFSAGVFFAFSDVLTRIASGGMDRKIIVAISLLVGTPILWFTGIALGEPFPSMKIAFLFAVIGLIHFGLARYLFYTAIAGIGASAAAITTSPTLLFASFFAWVFLGENLSLTDILGAIFVTIAVFLVGYNPSGKPLQGTNKIVGLLAGLSSSLLFAISTTIVRFATTESASPTLGASISYSTALVPYLFLLLRKNRIVRESVKKRWYILVSILSGIIVTLAQLTRYQALYRIHVAETQILISLFPFHTLLIAFLLKKETKESIRPIHFLAALLAIVGMILFYYT